MASSIRLTVCDFYLAPPKIGFDPTFSEFRGSPVNQVPILRIFGATETGAKACLHVHGVFPYMYVPYEGIDNPLQQQYLLANALDKALNISLGQANSITKHVFKIVLVSGVPYYGYHEKEHQFFKIYLYNPNLIKKAAELLLNGSIMGRMFQPHEAHLPFALQFMIDYNLQGMDEVNCANLYHRRDPNAETGDLVSRDYFLQPTKVSSCEIEADVLAEDILNRLAISSSQGVVNPGIAVLWEDEQQRRRDQGRETQPTPMSTQQRNPSGRGASEEFHWCRLIDKLANVEEDSITSTQSSFLYPAEAPEGLINASFVEQHSSRQSEGTQQPSESSEDLMNTQDEELLDIFEELANSQIADENEEVDAIQEQAVEENEDAEDEVRESTEMSQPFNAGTLIEVNSSDDEGSSASTIDLFEDSTCNIFGQVDGADDAPKPEPRRKRLGARRTYNRANANTDSDTWLMQEINNVLERPEEVIQQLEEELSEELRIPEANLAMQMLNEEDAPSSLTTNVEPLIEPGPSKMLNSEDASSNKECVKRINSPTVDVVVFKRTLGTSRNRRKKMSVSVSVPNGEELEFDQSSVAVDVQNHNLKLSFELSPPHASASGEIVADKPQKKISIKPCFVKLERLKLPLEDKVEKVQGEAEETITQSLPEHNEENSNIVSAEGNLDGENINPPVQEQPVEELASASREIEGDNTQQPVLVQAKEELKPDAVVLAYETDDEMEPLHISTDDELESAVEDDVQIVYCSSQDSSSVDSAQQSPKKKRLSFSLQSPDKKDRRKRRRERRKRQIKFKVMTMSEMTMQLQSPQSKNCLAVVKKGPDKPADFSSDESQETSGMKSFYNLTLPSCDSVVIEPKEPPPRNLELSEFGLQPIKFQPPFYSEPADGNQPLSCAPCHLPVYTSSWHKAKALGSLGFGNTERRTVVIEPLFPPPTREELLALVEVEEQAPELVQMDNLQQARAVLHDNHLKVMHLELLAVSRGKLKPDPEIDPICAMFFLVHGDRGPFSNMGAIAVRTEPLAPGNLLSPEFKKRCQIVEIVPDELEAISRLVHLVQTENPDILMGYEIEMDSWGYVVQRAARLGLNLPNVMSRVPKTECHEVRNSDFSQGAIVEYSDLKIPGRIVLNLWRLLRHEIALQDYSLESVSFHLLRQRLAHHPASLLLSWWKEAKRCFLVSNHLLTRLLACHRLLDNLDLLGRTSELAKLFGIQFSEVLSRGSQFRVESMMLRLAKPRNFVPVSPGITQKATMKAPECIPLVMEPQSVFYEDPVAVLDFQSLYPSVIIAHNLCFSTCLGRVELLGKDDPFEFGCTILKVDPRKVKKLNPFISPNGVAFVPKSVRQGVLPAMLSEILETRLMVKQSLKFNKKDETLAKVLHARQLGLKLIANVTYGYTAANFSGRMPCIEVGDSVVSKGREILERAIRMVNENQHIWGGEVVYGDTDSMFVLFRGKTRQEAFDIAEQIAEAVTRDNPSPVKLKMEKVYQPCILQTKKRYVGFMYENKNQEEPVYEAKGIETVRRDGCPAVSKLLEKCLRILFATKDLSLVKRHTINYFQKVLLGSVSLQDFIFAKEFRGLSGYRPGACVPALELARQWVKVDRRAEPRRGQRVPYVIVAGAPGLPLIRLVRSPYQLLDDPALRLNAEYYLTRALVPPLARCFNLLSVDVASWLAEMPRRTIVGLTGKGSIAHFFGSVECPICRRQTRSGICNECKKKPQRAAVRLGKLISAKEQVRQAIERICGSCCGRNFDFECDSLACPVMYRRRREMADDGVVKLRQCLQDLSF